MRKLLLQLDSSRLPSVFDRVVAYDGGADEVMSYGGITTGEVRDLVYGCIFTRGPKDLKNTAVFIGGADMAAGEELLAAAPQAGVKALTVSPMLDSNGSNTTAGPPPPDAPVGARGGAAVQPLGVEGVETMDDGVTKEGVVCFGALAIGNLKTKLHKACIARLFERNDLVLDAETIADVARELMAQKP